MYATHSAVNSFNDLKHQMYLRDDVMEHGTRLVKCNGYSVSAHDDEEDYEDNKSAKEKHFDHDYDLQSSTTTEYNKDNDYDTYSSTTKFRKSFDKRYYLHFKVNLV